MSQHPHDSLAKWASSSTTNTVSPCDAPLHGAGNWISGARIEDVEVSTSTFSYRIQDIEINERLDQERDVVSLLKHSAPRSKEHVGSILSDSLGVVVMRVAGCTNTQESQICARRRAYSVGKMRAVPRSGRSDGQPRSEKPGRRT
jgi:hypothetical protein